MLFRGKMGLTISLDLEVLLRLSINVSIGLDRIVLTRFVLNIFIRLPPPICQLIVPITTKLTIFTVLTSTSTAATICGLCTRAATVLCLFEKLTALLGQANLGVHRITLMQIIFLAAALSALSTLSTITAATLPARLLLFLTFLAILFLLLDMSERDTIIFLLAAACRLRASTTTTAAALLILVLKVHRDNVDAILAIFLAAQILSILWVLMIDRIEETSALLYVVRSAARVIDANADR